MPIARPIPSEISTELKIPFPWFSIKTTQVMVIKATEPPTEISIPPVIMTIVRPHEITIRYALLLNRSMNC